MGRQYKKKCQQLTSWKPYTLNHPNLNIPFHPWCWWFWNHQHQRLLIPPSLFWSLPCYLWSSPLHLWSLPCYLWSPPPHLWTSQLAPTVVANYFSSKTFLHQRSLQIFQQTQLVEHFISCCKLSLGSSTVIRSDQLTTDPTCVQGNLLYFWFTPIVEWKINQSNNVRQLCHQCKATLPTM